MFSGTWELKPDTEIFEEPGTVAVCMAAYKPNANRFRTQIESIINQTYKKVVVIISDETPNGDVGVSQLLSGYDQKNIFVFRAQKRVGFSLNFERSILMSPKSCDYICLSDQDDCWYPHKIHDLVCNIDDNLAIFSDFVCMKSNGGIISETQWVNRSPNHKNIADLILFNAVSGASMMMSRDLVKYIVPFPRFDRMLYDHWIAVIAAMLGKLEHYPHPLYNYMQHEENAIGFNYIRNKRNFLRNVKKHTDKIVSGHSDPYRYSQIEGFSTYIINFLHALSQVIRDRFLDGQIGDDMMRQIEFIISHVLRAETDEKFGPISHDNIMNCDISIANLESVCQGVRLRKNFLVG